MEKDKFLSQIKKIGGWLSDHEALFLYLVAREQSGTGDMVEIGSWHGKSTVSIGLGCRQSQSQSQVYAVDPHLGVYGANQPSGKSTLNIFNKNIKESGLQKYVIPVVSTSQKAVKKWTRPISFLFIDGLHDYKNSKLDYILWNKFITRGGIIAFHDAFCAYDGVWQTVRDKFLKREDLTELGVVGSIIFGRIGKPNFIQRNMVRFKKNILKFANFFNSFKLPWIIRLVFVHKFLRLFIITKYSRQIQFL